MEAYTMWRDNTKLVWAKNDMFKNSPFEMCATPKTSEGTVINEHQVSISGFELLVL